MIDHIQDAYKILFKVFKEKSYSTQALFKDKVSNLTSRIVLGVLEKNVYIEYVIKSSWINMNIKCHNKFN